MNELLNKDAIQIFIAFIFPGLISMHIYRLLMPARVIAWNTALLEGLFYSVINLALVLPLFISTYNAEFINDHPAYFSICLLIAVIIGPTIWPFLLIWLRKRKCMHRLFMHPYPRAWDFFFDQKKSAFMLIKLKNGKRIGGFYGPGSFASAYPDDGDLYLRAVYEINDAGQFVKPVPDTRGLLLRKDEYSYIELFDVPQQGDNTNV